VGADIALAVAVACAAFAVQRGLRFKRLRQADDRRLEQKDLARRRHHFRGAADVELPDTGDIDNRSGR